MSELVDELEILQDQYIKLDNAKTDSPNRSPSPNQRTPAVHGLIERLDKLAM